jgi:hypothetical protein
VDERGIEPHVNLIDKTERTDGTLSRSDFVFDPPRNLYVCPGGKELRKYHRTFAKPRDGPTKEGGGATQRAKRDLRRREAGVRVGRPHGSDFATIGFRANSTRYINQNTQGI